MADQVTGEKTPEEIEREMLSTRESITEKVAALESQVVGTVQNVAETINGTVDAVKSLVSTAPNAVSDTVKQATASLGDAVRSTLDVTGHVRQHPWESVGASALLGCITAWLVFRDRPERSEVSPLSAAAIPPAAAAAAPAAPGIFDEVLGMISAKVKEVARTALESASTMVKENLQGGMAQLMETAKEWTQEKLTPDHAAQSNGLPRREPVGFGAE